MKFFYLILPILFINVIFSILGVDSGTFTGCNGMLAMLQTYRFLFH